ncbi:MAG: cupin domain-containing protein [Calditrichaeota bacterium]|nr:MAG: cupin domain-containing protein [Calditrichota bacterium]
MGVVHKFKNRQPSFLWDGIKVEEYKSGGARDAIKQVIIGPEDGSQNFVIRYFEIAPGGKSSLDKHSHDHGIVVLRGKGRVLLGREVHELSFGDAVYIAPFEEHQFENMGDEPFGFLCVIRPKEKKNNPESK